MVTVRVCAVSVFVAGDAHAAAAGFRAPVLAAVAGEVNEEGKQSLSVPRAA